MYIYILYTSVSVCLCTHIAYIHLYVDYIHSVHAYYLPVISLLNLHVLKCHLTYNVQVMLLTCQKVLYTATYYIVISINITIYFHSIIIYTVKILGLSTQLLTSPKNNTPSPLPSCLQLASSPEETLHVLPLKTASPAYTQNSTTCMSKAHSCRAQGTC